MSAVYIKVHFSQDFSMEEINMNPDHTAQMEQPDLGAYCLQYRQSKNISRHEEQMKQEKVC